MNTTDLTTASHDDLDDGWDLHEEDALAAHRLSLLRTYFARFGLCERTISETASRSVLNSVLRECPHAADEATIERRLIAVARTWVRDFSETSVARSGDWLSRAPVLLSKFPGAFLATPVPERRALR